MTSTSDPAQIVRHFLATMQARDLELARSHLAPCFTMVFPGSKPMTTLDEMLEWSKPRYQNVRKIFLGLDVVPMDGDLSVVYCRGTLSGAWLDGTEFDSIRFIDRFELVAGQITRQDVWNDVAEAKAAL